MNNKQSAINNKRLGFTLIELLTTIAIIGILSGLAIPAFALYARRQTLTQAAENLASDIRATRSQAVSAVVVGVSGRSWGVHLANNTSSYEVFSVAAGTYAYSGATISETKTLPSGVTYTLSHHDSGPANLVFDRLYGTTTVARNNGNTLVTLGPATSFRITLSLSLAGTSRTVTVGAGGNVTVQ